MQLLTITGFDQLYRKRVNQGYGNIIMAAILQFQKRSTSERPVFELGHSATILIFNGVRIERIDFEAMREKARAAAEAPTRIAN